MKVPLVVTNSTTCKKKRHG